MFKSPNKFSKFHRHRPHPITMTKQISFQYQLLLVKSIKQVVKLIWHNAASPPQTDGSIVFTSWCQCAPPHTLPWTHQTQHPTVHLDWFSCFFAQLTAVSYALQKATPRDAHGPKTLARPQPKLGLTWNQTQSSPAQPNDATFALLLCAVDAG